MISHCYHYDIKTIAKGYQYDSSDRRHQRGYWQDNHSN